MKTDYILGKLEEMGFTINDNVDDSNYYLSCGDVLMEVVRPHEGNDYTTVVRADFFEVFDKWGNAPWQWNIKDLEEFNVNVVFTIVGLVHCSLTRNRTYLEYLKEYN